MFYILQKYIQHSIIEQGKFWKTKTNLKQVVITFKTMLVILKGSKTKCSYVLAIGFKAEAKLVFQSIHKKLAVYYVISFVNQEQKMKTCIDSNQVIQIQNQSLFANSKSNKPHIFLILDNISMEPTTKYFNCQSTDCYSQNCSNLEYKKRRSLGNGKSQ